MLQWRLGAEFCCERRNRLRLPINVAPAWRDDKGIVGGRIGVAPFSSAIGVQNDRDVFNQVPLKVVIRPHD
jgi:hypothetical protein